MTIGTRTLNRRRRKRSEPPPQLILETARPSMARSPLSTVRGSVSSSGGGFESASDNRYEGAEPQAPQRFESPSLTTRSREGNRAAPASGRPPPGSPGRSIPPPLSTVRGFHEKASCCQATLCIELWSADGGLAIRLRRASIRTLVEPLWTRCRSGSVVFGAARSVSTYCGQPRNRSHLQRGVIADNHRHHRKRSAHFISASAV